MSGISDSPYVFSLQSRPARPPGRQDPVLRQPRRRHRGRAHPRREPGCRPQRGLPASHPRRRPRHWPPRPRSGLQGRAGAHRGGLAPGCTGRPERPVVRGPHLEDGGAEAKCSLRALRVPPPYRPRRREGTILKSRRRKFVSGRGGPGGQNSEIL